MGRIPIIIQDFLVTRLAVSRCFSVAQLQEAACSMAIWQLVVHHQIWARSGMQVSLEAELSSLLSDDSLSPSRCGSSGCESECHI